MNEKKTIVVAIPNRSHNSTEISVGLARLLTELKAPKGYKLVIHFSYKQPVDANRNLIVKTMLKNEKAEWLLMIDNDIVPPNNILDMIKCGEKIVSAVVMGMSNGVPHPLAMRMRKDGLYSMVNLMEYIEGQRDDGLIEVDGAGTGCILIHRSVLEKMKTNWFRFQYTEEGSIKYSEDYSFSQKVKELGYKIYVDTNFICEHYKRIGLLRQNRLLYKMLKSGSIKGIIGKGNDNI